MIRALIAVALATTSCKIADSPYFGKVDRFDPEVMRYCNSGEPEYVDPALVTSTTGTPLARLMFAGLMEYGPDMAGTAQPSIATRWEVSEDQRVFTFWLRDDIVWSDGKPLNAHDFVYHVTRILHPKSVSRNTQPLEPVKNASAFNSAKIKVLTADAGPFKKGDIVQVIGRDGVASKPEDLAKLPNSNVFKSSKTIGLRDLGAPESGAYLKVPPGAELDLIELETAADGQVWAYVFTYEGNWRYGWVPFSELDQQVHGGVEYLVREIGPERRPGVNLPPDPSFVPREATIDGKYLLMLPEVLGIRAEGNYKLVVETANPTPYLIDDMRGRLFRPTPRHSVARDPKGWTRPENGLMVTSGGFVMTLWAPRDRMEFSRNPLYHEADRVKIQTFISYNMNDQAASANLYYQGGCDIMSSNNIPNSYLPILTGANGGQARRDYYIKPYLGIYYYVVNTEKLQNRHLRRAMSMAIDRSAITELLYKSGYPGASFTPGVPISTLTPEQRRACEIPEGTTEGVAAFVTPEHCYHSPPGLEFNPEAARAELARAREQLGDKFPKYLELKFNTGVEQHKVIAEYIQDQWKRNLGLDFTIQVQEWTTYLKDTTAGNFMVGRLGWIGGTPDPESQFLIIFRCNEDGVPGPYNRARWCNKEFNALYDKAQTVLDRGERLAILRQAEELIASEVPVINLYVYTQRHLRKPYVRGLSFQLADQVPLQYGWIDPDWRDDPEVSE
jgi:oligopeptide transport system substrate-binding protein